MMWHEIDKIQLGGEGKGGKGKVREESKEESQKGGLPKRWSGYMRRKGKGGGKETSGGISGGWAPQQGVSEQIRH